MMNFKNSLNWIKKRWGNILIYALLALLIFSPDAKSWLLQQVVSTGLLKADIKEANTGKLLPDAENFTFTNATGKTATIADLKDKVIFINFWASWCPPCRAEMPDLENLYQKLKDDNRFVFLFINEDEDQSKGIDYLEKNHFTIPFYTRSGASPARYSAVHCPQPL